MGGLPPCAGAQREVGESRSVMGDRLSRRMYAVYALRTMRAWEPMTICCSPLRHHTFGECMASAGIYRLPYTYIDER